MTFTVCISLHKWRWEAIIRSELMKTNKKQESEYKSAVISRTLDFYEWRLKILMQFTRVNQGTLRNV